MQYGVTGSERDKLACELARDRALDEAIEQRSDLLDVQFLLSLEAYIGACMRANDQTMSVYKKSLQNEYSNKRTTMQDMNSLLAILHSIREKARFCETFHEFSVDTFRRNEILSIVVSLLSYTWYLVYR